MGNTNKSNLVSKYPCLYDKTAKGFKERDIKQNAWAKVEAMHDKLRVFDVDKKFV